MAHAADYRETAEAAVSWVLGQVCGDEGPWLPARVASDGSPPEPQLADDRDSLYQGVGAFALLFAEIRQTRPLSAEEEDLAEAVRRRLVDHAAEHTDPSLYFGLAGDVTALRLLGGPGDVDVPLALLAARATPAGWSAPLTAGGEPVPVTDVVLGAAGITMAARWSGGTDAAAVVAAGGRAMLDAADERTTGLDWPMQVGVPRSERARMPNYSHGTAGVAAALAIAAEQLGRADLLDAAVRGAEHLVALADLADDGFLLPTMDPHTNPDVELVTFTWCHGPAGTSYLFPALAKAGVERVAGVAVEEWWERCLRSVMTSGIPERLRPGFWDNDGRCCGTAGVGEVFLDAAQRVAGAGAERAYLDFAGRMGDALLERVVRDDEGARWRFVEHRNEEPLLDPSPGWMQGAMGIAAFLFRLARVMDDGMDAPVVDRPDSWWAVPERLRT
ncbi:MAG TPA: lanthionine synthetase LanC family protein, partial [Actinomycetes bacterium]|nr:lanthionine synthetase LanC family protein [Actinomycetes bacterium]